MRITVVIPCLNEEKFVERSVRQAVNCLRENFPADRSVVVVADNGSTDHTRAIASTLATEFSEVRLVSLNVRGKGLAVLDSWRRFPSDVACFMDADLATDLAHLPKMIRLVADGMDVVVGSRQHPAAQVRRPISRRFFSFGYRLWLAWMLPLPVTDAACGFKAISSRCQKEILPSIKNQGFFFDTELLARAAARGLRIFEMPIVWKEPHGRKSTVNPVRLALRQFGETMVLRRELKSCKK